MWPPQDTRSRRALQTLLASTRPGLNTLWEAAGHLTSLLVAQLHHELGEESGRIAAELFAGPEQPDRVEYPVSLDATGNTATGARFHYADGRTATAQPAHRAALLRSELQGLLDDHHAARAFAQAWHHQDSGAHPVTVVLHPAVPGQH